MNDDNTTHETKERWRFFRTCEDHLAHARERHPLFAERAINSLTYIAEVESWADAARKESAEERSVQAVLFSEVFEFLAELQRGDLARAREEGADIIAVLLRALEGDIKPQTNKETANER